MSDRSNGAGRIITVFGGSGFIGRHVVGCLARDGWRVRVACRNPDHAYFLQPLGRTGQICAVKANVRDNNSIAAALKNASAAINIVGINVETSEQTFHEIYEVGATNVVRAAISAGIINFVHFSAIGANLDASSRYTRSKALGEMNVLETNPEAIVIRPTVVFGPEDIFLNRLAKLARYFPVIPLIGASTLFQPVYVGDVASAVTTAIARKAKSSSIYELGGPDIINLRLIADLVMKATDHQRYVFEFGNTGAKLLSIISRIFRAITFGLSPQNYLFTCDPIELLEIDCIVSQSAINENRTLIDLGVTPKSIELIAPTYLYRYRSAGQYHSQRLES